MTCSITSAPSSAQPFSVVEVQGTGGGADSCSFEAICNGQVIAISSTTWAGASWTIELVAPACEAERSNQITVTVTCGKCEDDVDIPLACP